MRSSSTFCTAFCAAIFWSRSPYFSAALAMLLRVSAMRPSSASISFLRARTCVSSTCFCSFHWARSAEIVSFAFVHSDNAVRMISILLWPPCGSCSAGACAVATSALHSAAAATAVTENFVKACMFKARSNDRSGMEMVVRFRRRSRR